MSEIVEIPKDKRTHILAVDRRYVEEICKRPDGYSTNSQSCLNERMKGHLITARRFELEKNDRYMQLLPYITVLKQRDDGTITALTYQRTKKIGEERLADKYSFAVGGHIDKCDFVYNEDGDLSLYGTINNNIIRELNEELLVTDKEGKEYRLVWPSDDGEQPPAEDEIEIGLLPLGLISEYSDEKVGKYHLGIHYALMLDDDFNIAIREESLIDHGFLTFAEIEKLPIENWTKLALNYNKPVKTEEAAPAGEATPA